MDRFPKPGETILGRSFGIFPGGKGANQAVGCGRLGKKTYMVGKMGKSFRDFILNNFERNNVDTSYVFTDDNVETGVALIYVNEATGENMIVVDPGADYLLKESDIDMAENAISSSKVILTQLEIPTNVVEYAIMKASKYVNYVILNPAPAKRLSDRLLKNVDVITPNRHEASVLSGIEVVDMKTAVQAGKELLKSGVDHVIITMGSEGALLVERDAAYIYPSFKVNVVDTTGAGDAFNSGLAYGLASGFSLYESVKIAVATAALKITKMGAQTGLPWLYELEAFMREKSYIEYKTFVGEENEQTKSSS